MISKITRLSLPNKEYLELFGGAICAYNQLVALIIEIVWHEKCDARLWSQMLDDSRVFEKEMKNFFDEQICKAFHIVSTKRNRIVHSVQITHNGEQVMYTKSKDKDGGERDIIDTDYLVSFLGNVSDIHYKLDKLRMTLPYMQKIK